MATWAPLRKDTLAALADEILHNYSRGRVIVAIDGQDGAHRAEFADDLAEAIGASSHAAFRASMAGFSRPRGDREKRGPDSAEGAYRDFFDHDALARELITPFRAGGDTSFSTAVLDAATDSPAEPRSLTGPDDAVLVIDGPYLNRPELSGFWNYSVWVDVDAEPPAAQQLYVREVSPRTRATAIVDNTDVEHPRRSFADSC